MPEVTVLPSAANGDCFFDSVAQALRSGGIAAANVKSLRHCVAETVLDLNDVEANGTIRQWRSLLCGALLENDRALIHEYLHAWPLVSKCVEVRRAQTQQRLVDGVNVQAPLSDDERKALEATFADSAEVTQEQRDNLYDVMMTNRYQGEEYAIRVLESKMGVRVRVYQSLRGLDGGWHANIPAGDATKRPKYVCALLHSNGVHFEPIAFDGHMLFHYRGAADSTNTTSTTSTT